MPRITFKIELSNRSDEVEMLFASDKDLVSFLDDMASGRISQEQFDNIMRGNDPRVAKQEEEIAVIILGDLSDLPFSK